MNKEELRKEIKQLKMRVMLDKDENNLINYQNRLIDILPENPEYINEYKDLSIFKLKDTRTLTIIPSKIEGKRVLENITIDLYYEETIQIIRSRIIFSEIKTNSCKLSAIYLEHKNYQYINFLKYKNNIGYFYNIDIYLLIKTITERISKKFKIIISSDAIINLEYGNSKLFKFKISNLENYNNINKVMLSK